MLNYRWYYHFAWEIVVFSDFSEELWFFLKCKMCQNDFFHSSLDTHWWAWERLWTPLSKKMHRTPCIKFFVWQIQKILNYRWYYHFCWEIVVLSDFSEELCFFLKCKMCQNDFFHSSLDAHWWAWERLWTPLSMKMHRTHCIKNFV